MRLLPFFQGSHISVIEFIITNPNPGTALTSVAFTDGLPTSVFVAAVPGKVNTCGGTLAATGGGTAIILSGGSLVAGATCKIDVNVTSATIGTYTNTTGNVSANGTGPGNTARAILRVLTPPSFPTIAISLSSTSIKAGNATTLTFTITNPNPLTGLTNVSISTTLPSNVTIDAAPKIVGNCGGGIVTAVASGSAITLTGGAIPGGTNCVFSVDITGSVGATYTIQTGAVSSYESGTGSASNSLQLNVIEPPTLSKQFVPASTTAGVSSQLQITITNPANNPVAASGITLTDSFQAGLIVAVNNGLNNTCPGIATAAPGSSSVSLSAGAGTLAPGASCTIDVNVVSLDGSGTVFNNAAHAVSVNGGAGPDGTASLTMTGPPLAPPQILKQFSPSTVAPGGRAQLILTITNPNSTLGLTGVSATDVFPTGLVVDYYPQATNTCGPTLSGATAGSTTLALNGVTMTASEICQVTVYVTNVTATPINNTAGPVAADNNNVGLSSTATLNVSSTTPLNPPAISKGYSVGGSPISEIIVGGTTTLTITLSNNNPIDLIDASFTDTLPNGIVIAPIPNASTTCAASAPLANPTLSAAIGSHSIGFSGATIPAGAPGTCTVMVDVVVTGLGTNTNTFASGALTTFNDTAASAYFQISITGDPVLPPAVSKSYSQKSISPVAPNNISTLTISLTNSDPFAITGVAFTDRLGALSIATPSNLKDTCIGNTASATANSITVSSDSIPANGSCTIAVDVTGTIAGVYLNSIDIGKVSTTNAGSNTVAATDTLTVQVNPPTISKQFIQDPINGGGVSTLKLTLGNSNTFDLTNVAFIDDLSGTGINGVFIASPLTYSNTCGGSLTANAGGQSIQLSGGTIPASGSCVITVDVTSPTGSVTPYDNTIEVGKLTASYGVSNTIAADATLTVNTSISQPTILKSFSPNTVGLGADGASTMQFVISNPDPTATLNDIAFSDNFAALGITLSSGTPLLQNTCNGTLTGATSGSSSLSLSGASLIAGANCTISVKVSGAALGAQLNTTSTITSSNGGTGAASSATLTVSDLPPTVTKQFASPVSAGVDTPLTITLTDPNGTGQDMSGLAFTDLLSGGLLISATPALVNTCNGSVTVAPFGSSIVLSGGTITANSTGTASCSITVNVFSPTTGSYPNALKPGSVSSNYGSNTNTGSDTLLVQGADIIAPVISKSFSPSTGVPTNVTGGTTLNITINNPNSLASGIVLNGVQFSDDLSPLYMTIAALKSSTCGGTVTADPGTALISLAGGSIAAGGSCLISVSVTASQIGSYLNTTTQVESANGGIGNTASNTVVVAELPPTVQKAFADHTLLPGQPTTLTITIGNPNGDTMTGIYFSDALPGASNPLLNGLQVGIHGLLSNTCGGNVLAVPYTTSISLSKSNSGAIPGDTSGTASCQIQVEVFSPTGGTYPNTLAAGSVHSDFGPNTDIGSDTLTYTSPDINPPDISKQFDKASVRWGVEGAATLTFTITNTNATALNDVAFYDSFPNGLQVAAPLTVSDNGNCGAPNYHNAAAGDGLLNVTHITIPAFVAPATSTICAISVAVTTTTGSLAGVLLHNRSDFVTSSNGGVGNRAMADITSYDTPPTIAKQFLSNPANAGLPTTLQFTLHNPNSVALTDAAFTDTLPSPVVIDSPANISSANCGTAPTLSITATPGTNSIQVTGGTIPANGSGDCVITVEVVSPTAGTFTNQIPIGALTTSHQANNAAANQDLVVQGSVVTPSMTKSYDQSSIEANIANAATLTFTITNPNADIPYNGLAFTDTLPTGLEIGTGSTTNSCGGTLTAVAGSGTIKLTNGTLAAAGLNPPVTCQITVPVTGTAAGTLPNTAGYVTTINAGTSSAQAKADITVYYLSPTVVKSFAGIKQTTTGTAWSMSIQITNPNPAGSDMSNVAFTDHLPALVPGPGQLEVASPATVTGSCNGGTVTAVDFATTISLSGGALAHGASCTITVNVFSPTPGTYTNTLKAGDVTATINGSAISSATDSSDSLLISASLLVQPTFSKAFGQPAIALNVNPGTPLTFTIDNTNNASIGPLTFNDTMPSNVQIANPNGEVYKNCGTGQSSSDTATVVSLTITSIPANTICTITLNVKGIAAGAVQTNTTGPITVGNIGIGGTASADIQVVANLPPVVGKAFSVPNAASGTLVLLTITITNPNAAGHDMTNVAFTDTLPTGLIIATPVTTSQCNGGTVSATPYTGNTISLSGGTIPGNNSGTASCTVTVKVFSTAHGDYPNDLSGVKANIGGLPYTSVGTAHASITMTGDVSAAGFTKTFNKSSIPLNLNGAATLTFTIDNTANAVALIGAAFTDTFPSGLQIASPNGESDSNCGTLTLTDTAGTGTFNVSGGTIAPGAVCTITLNVTGTIGSAAGTLLKNITGALSFTNYGSVGTAEGSITVIDNPPVVSKLFDGLPTSTITAGSISLLTITLSNANGAALTNATFIDSLPGGNNGVLIASPNGLSNTCGGTLTALPFQKTISLSGGTIPAATLGGGQSDVPGTCTISLKVSSPTLNMSPGYENDIAATALTTSGLSNATGASAVLLVNGPSIAQPVIGKAFSVPTIPLGGTTTLTFTLSNPNTVVSGLTLLGLQFADTLPGGIQVASVPNIQNASCGGGTAAVTAVAGSNTITYSGGTLAAGTSCQIQVDIKGVSVGNQSNDVTIFSTNGGVGNLANAMLFVIGPPTIDKGFSPSSVSAGSTSLLTFTLGNPSNNGSNNLQGVNFTDVLPTSPDPLLIDNGTQTNTCGGTLTADVGTGTISLTGGMIPAGSPGTCIVSVPVVTFTIGTYNNLSGNVNSTNGGKGLTASAPLTVTPSGVPPDIDKQFAPATIPESSYSVMTLTLSNPPGNSYAQIGVQVDDPFPAGLSVYSTPNLQNTCGGTVTGGTPGATSLGISGVNLAIDPAIGSSCTLSVNVTGIANTYSNATTTVSSKDGGIGGTASATLQIIAPPVIVKSFSPTPILPGSTSTLTLTLNNPAVNLLTLTGASVTDTFVSGVVVASTPNTTANGCGTNWTFNASSPTPNALPQPNDTAIDFSGGTIDIGGSCTITVDVYVPAEGSYPDTTGKPNSIEGGEGVPSNTVTLTAITPPHIVKSFAPHTIAVNGTATMTFTITNPNASSTLNGVGVVDPLPNNLVVASSPVTTVSLGCGGGTLSPAPKGGNTSVTFSGGTIAPGAVCTITVPVTSGKANDYTNTTQPATSTNGGNGNTGSDTLHVLTVIPYFDLGNRVWIDDGKGTPANYDNGKLDAGEVGVPAGVALTLTGTDTDNNAVTLHAVTDAKGYYRFDNLFSGTYTVTIDALNFQSGHLLQNYVATKVVKVGTDSNNNGSGSTPAISGISSSPVTLGLGLQPATEPDHNTNSTYSDIGPNGISHDNLTVDFGVIPQFDLGNRVWFDTNNNGVLDNGESSVPAGITLTLTGHDAGNTAITPLTATTDSAGYYRFDSLPPGTYVVKVDAANFTTGLLQSYSPSITGTVGTDSNNNGTGASPTTTGVSSGNITLGLGLQPATEPDHNTSTANSDIGPSPLINDNLTVDFGFVQKYDLGNRVWIDDGKGTPANYNNGVLDTGEVGVPVGVTLTLSGTDINGGSVSKTTTTNSNGYYRFDNLLAGTYTVTLAASNFQAGGKLQNYLSSQVGASAGSADSNNVAHTANPATTGVVSPPVTLGPNKQTISAIDQTGLYSVSSPSNSTYGPNGSISDNLAVDFGVIPQFDLGNRVWIDDGGGVAASYNNGVWNSVTEKGVPAGVTLTLTGTAADGSAVSLSTLTDAKGYYRFDNLAEGTYTVTIDALNFQPSHLLQNYVAAKVVKVGTDSNNNGTGSTPAISGISSGSVILSLATQPTATDVATGTIASNYGPNGSVNDNLAVDFGVIPQFDLGNRIWFDTNNNGILDNGESSVPSGVSLTLTGHDAGGTAITALHATTDSAGYYRFDNLPPGTYVATVDASNFTGIGSLLHYVPSVLGTTGTDSNNNGTGASPTTTGVSSGPITLGLGLQPATETDHNTSTANSDIGPSPLINDNLTVDFGFLQKFDLGNRIWIDNGGGTLGNYNNGLLDNLETGAPAGVTLTLNGTDVNGAVTKTTTTDANGYYRFDNLLAGTYTVTVDAINFTGTGKLLHYASTKLGPNPGTVDSNNIAHAASPTTTGIVSPIVTLGIGLETVSASDINVGSANGNYGPNGSTNDNLAVDFGVISQFDLGNRVWIDDGGGVPASYNNGIWNGATEKGVPAGVTLTLTGIATNGGAVTLPAVTDANGYYRFDNLLAGVYTVTIDATNFQASGLLQNYVATKLGTIGADSNSNGTGSTPAVSGISSGLVTIGPGLQLAAETDHNTYSTYSDIGPNGLSNDNLRIDFGVIPQFDLGNRVWFDTNNNGVLDTVNPSESGVSGVSLTLSGADAGGTAITPLTATTDSAGYYRFDNLPPGTYVVTVDAANFTGTGKLLNDIPTVPGIVSTDSNNNGIGASPTTTGVSSGNITLGLGLQPATEPDHNSLTTNSDIGLSPLINDNLTVDFGFLQKYDLGNRVWIDDGKGTPAHYNNGYWDGTESGVPAGVTLTLNGTDANGPITALHTTTDANGYYRFDNLLAGTYTVTVDAANFQTGGKLQNYASSKAGATGIDSNNVTHEASPATNGISSPLVTLGIGKQTIIAVDQSGSYSSGSPANSTYGPGGSTNDNLAVDFGVIPQFDLGNRVWFDTNNNGVLDTVNPSESGVSGVSLTLSGADAGGTAITPLTATTDSAGYYRFDNLPPGTYVVTVDAANFTGTGKLLNDIPTVPGIVSTDSNNNGAGASPTTTGVSSGIITLGLGLQPATEPDHNSLTTNSDIGPSPLINDNLTVDFGFLQKYDLGNRVWIDDGKGIPAHYNNGQWDGTESGVPAGVTLTLNGTDANGPITALHTTTDANGYYRFDNLLAGTYTVTVDAANFQTGGKLQNYASSKAGATGIDSNNVTHEASPATNGINSPLVTLGIGKQTIIAVDQTGSYSSGSPANSTYGPGGSANDNLAVDFGVIPQFDLGNRVWFDTNNDGVLNNGESGVPAGITLTLTGHDAGGTAITALHVSTDSAGYYRFDNLPPGTYVVKVDAANFVSGSLLHYIPTVLGTLPADGNNNGIGASPTTTGVSSGNITLGLGLQPATEPDHNTSTANSDIGLSPLINDNLTVDFGFLQKYDLGNRVWYDNGGGTAAHYNNGQWDSTESGVPTGVALTLRGTDINGSVTRKTTTDANGYYRFDNLLAGHYTVTVDAANFQANGKLQNDLSSKLGTTGIDSSNVTHEANPATNGITSPTITLGIGDQTVSAKDLNVGSPNGNYGPNGSANDNLTVDFGVIPRFDLGNRVWIDDGRGAPAHYNNGVLDIGEKVAPAGVTLTLTGTAANGSPITLKTVTDVNGYYRFDNLADGIYTVTLDASNFNPTGLLRNYAAAKLGAIGTDSNNNGTGPAPATSGISNAPVTLGLGLQPSVEPDHNATSASSDVGPNGILNDNLTIDFGVIPLFDLGNRVWFDMNDNGLLNTVESGVPAGVSLTVTGHDFAGAAISARQTTTDGSGYYRFDSLPMGTYVVTVDAKNFQTGGLLLNYIPSRLGTARQDSNNNGTGSAPATTAVSSGAVSLGYGPQPTVTDVATGTSSSDYGPSGADRDYLVVDFGFVQKYDLGNRVWYDNGGGVPGHYNNGFFDSGEKGAVGVSLSLTGADINGPVTKTITTDANGYYRFDNLLAGTYTVTLDAANFQPGGKLQNFPSSIPGPNAGSADGNNVTHATNPALTGILSPAVTLGIGKQTIPATDINASSPNGNYGPNGNANDNLTIDFGVIPRFDIGNRVWYDNGAGNALNLNNGVLDKGEAGVPGVTVSLTGTDVNGSTIAPLHETTDGSGYYRFDNLPEGMYTLTVDALNFQSGYVLQNYLPSVPGPNIGKADSSNNGTSATPDTTGDSSGLITLGPGRQTVVANDVNSASTYSNYGPGGTANDNLTVDFGVYPKGSKTTYSIGNRVWYDTGTGGVIANQNNGILDTGEIGVPVGVTLTLSGKDTDNNSVTLHAQTDDKGYYRFDGLTAGTYTVTLDATNFQPGGLLQGATSSTAVTTSVDNHNNGTSTTPAVSGISSGPVTVGAGSLPANVDFNTNSANSNYGPTGQANSDLTVDFGILPKYDLGNRVWYDNGAGTAANLNNGRLDAGETGVPSVTLTLNGTDSFRIPIAPQHTTTDANGYYRFDNLVAGTYTVIVDAKNFQPGGALQYYLPDTIVPPPGSIDNQNNGTGATPAVSGVSSGLVTLGPGPQPAATDVSGRYPANPLANSTYGPNGATDDNLIIDFGVYPNLSQSYSIGNRVWLDNGTGTGGKADDGLQNGTEAGIPAAPIKLFNADTSGNPVGLALQSISSDSLGYYRFDSVTPGRYVVVLDLPTLNGSGSAKYKLTALSFSNYQVDQQNMGQQTLLGPTSPLPGGIVSPLIYITNPATPSAVPPSTNPVNGATDIGVGLGAHGTGYHIAPPAADDMEILTADFGLVTTVIAPPASYSIGNRVWLDNGAGNPANLNNGKQDSGEIGIPNVTVLLYANSTTSDGSPSGSPLMTTKTDADGYYRFDSVPAGKYIVVVDSSPLLSPNLVGMLPDTTGSTIYSTAGDEFNKGTRLNPPPTGVTVSAIASGVIDTALAATTLNEPDVTSSGAGAHGPLGDSSDVLTVDFGFYPDTTQTYSIGNRVWLDNGIGPGGVNNDGIQNGSESGIAGVRLELFYADSAGTIIGSAPLQITSTDGTGYYRFDDVTPGTYVVVVDKGGSPVLNNLSPSAVTATDFSKAGDQHSKGTLPPLLQSSPVAGGISSKAIIIAAGTMPLNEPDFSGTFAIASGHGPNGDAYDILTVDFGFSASTPTYSIGNRVWSDINGDGQQQPAEPGVPGVIVSLYTADATGAPLILVGTVTTDSLGFYRFDGLIVGDYVAIVDVTHSATLNGAKLSKTLVTAPITNTTDGLNNGTTTIVTVVPGGVTSGLIALGARPIEPLGELQPLADVSGSVFSLANAPQASDDHGNLTIDFGFILPPSPSDTSSNSAANPSAFDPAIVKLVDPSLALPGEQVKFTIILSNPGTVAATNVIVSDPIPDRLVYTGADTPLGTFRVNGNTVTFNIGTLPANQTITMHVFAKINPNVVPPLDLTNTATATLNGKTISATTISGSAALHITRGLLPGTGEQPNENSNRSVPNDLLLAVSMFGLVLAVLRRRRSIRLGADSSFLQTNKAK